MCPKNFLWKSDLYKNQDRIDFQCGALSFTEMRMISIPDLTCHPRPSCAELQNHSLKNFIQNFAFRSSRFENVDKKQYLNKNSRGCSP